MIQAGIRRNEFMRQNPTEKQAAALLFDCRELFYGGAGGGGKSSYLLMAALQYVDVPGYSAGIFRRRFADLTKPKGLIDRSHEFMAGTLARYTGQNHRWTFPSGATISFWGVEHLWDVYAHSSSEYQFIGLDELTDFHYKQYEFLQTRLRRSMSMRHVPLRIRAASNPPFEEQTDGDWVKDYFVDGADGDERIYIPARLEDNKHVDAEAYRAGLSHLDPVIVARILEGDWTVRPAGMMFQRQWFEIVDELPADIERTCRGWDMAATKPKRGRDPDSTAGVLVGRSESTYYIIDVIKVQTIPGDTDALMKQTAAIDHAKWGDRYTVREEQEGGSSGPTVIAARTKEMAGYDYEGSAPKTSKAMRARPLSVQAKAGNVKILRGHWNKAYLDELERFPGGTHDDQVDATTLAFSTLVTIGHGMLEYYKARYEKQRDANQEATHG